jgi:hypothetical protein
MKFGAAHVALGLVLIFWGMMLLEWIAFDDAGSVLGIGAVIAGVLVMRAPMESGSTRKRK